MKELDVKELDQSVLYATPLHSSRTRDAPSQVPEGINKNGTNMTNEPAGDKDELEA